MRRSPLQSANAWKPSVRMLSGRERVESATQDENASEPIFTRLSGKETVRTFMNPENALAPTDATPSERTTRSRVPAEWSQGMSSAEFP